MTAPDPAPLPAPKDSQPDSDPAPSLPGPATLWRDSDLDAPQGPARSFATNTLNLPDEQAPTIGHIGRYALKYRLGEGGLGTVFAAHDPLLSRLIAVKTLNLEIDASEREAFNALFLNEARAAAGLSHPHIVTVFDAGISDDRAYIAMELLKGRDLRQLRQEGWRATPAQAALVVRRVADALAYAHSKGVVHRDVKPANIFMVGRTQPRVLDFGIARVAHRHEAGSAGIDIAAGSPYYMAPEQARQQTVDRRADVFSLGVVLYELLTDVKPFRGHTLDEITLAVLEHEPPLAHTVDAAVPQALAHIAARAMEKNPEQRYRSARAFSRELRHWLDENTVSLDNDLPVVAAPRRRGLWVALAVAGVLLAGGALWSLAFRGVTADRPARSAVPAVAATPTAAQRATADAETPIAPATSLGTESPAVADAMASAAAANPASAATVAVAPPVVPAVGAAKAAPAIRPAPKATHAATRTATRESTQERRAREARELKARALASVAAAAPATGVLRLAISPWGQVEVDGKAAGTSPPLTELSLPEGTHQITIRNADLPAFSASVKVVPGQPVHLKHRFGP
ncbi:MAG TPA: serine/threonine-protein kinase [Burkholderiaceae bacterium]|nr:serine/threonine-protein kinase [Burkholderiaceae bacterium]